MTIEEAYQKMQDACGIEEGDTVKVLRTAKDQELGWRNWWPPTMDEMVSHEYTVQRVGPRFGIYLSGYYFPWFVLELVKKRKDPPLEVTMEQVCEKFGCSVKIVKEKRHNGG